MRVRESINTGKIGRLTAIIFVVICLTFVLILVAELKSSDSSTIPVSFDETQKMMDCRSSVLQLTKIDKPDVVLLHVISDFCYTEIRREYLLGNFNIHRFNVLKQNFQTLVVMWMVVTITMSGVFLAGLQLLAAYRLAATGQGLQLAESSDLSLERGKISLKSSVTGLLVLTVSLAFFIVYVKWVYVLTPEPSGDASSAGPPASSSAIALRGVGGLVGSNVNGSVLPNPASAASIPSATGVTGPSVSASGVAK
jgi:hypothetical protein